MVQYCSADCQKAHRPQHKRECKKRAAEIFDESLFKQPPQKEDCPICFLTIPSMSTGRKYQMCCGKIICSGCIHAVDKMDGDIKCPFCRIPTHTSDEELRERVNKRVEVDDAEAIFNLGCYYYNGERGIPQDCDKALELWHRAGELGSANGYHNIGCAYLKGDGVDSDMEKAKHYYELAAIGGDVSARYNLGCIEEQKGNMNRALKHHIIAVGCGLDESLKEIRQFYINGYATKDDYAEALRAHQNYVGGIKSPQRDEAAAFNSKKLRYY